MLERRIDFMNLVGKRVLISSGYGLTFAEVIVKEVSPDGRFVKLKFVDGGEGWKKVSNVNVECVLDEGDEGASESSADKDKLLRKERKELLRKVCREIEVLVSDAYDDRKSTDYIDGLKRAWEKVEELLEMEN